MMWVIPALMLVLLAVFGVAAFAIIWAQQTSERAAQATATAAVQAANSKATSTAVTRRRTATARANATGTAEAVAIADATSTAEAIIFEDGAQSTATAQAYATETAANIDPTARKVEIQQVYLEHNIYNTAGLKGMNIHVVFTTDNLKDVPLEVSAYFYWQSDGAALVALDDDGTNVTTDNQVAVRKDTQSLYDASIFDNFYIFIPYEELELDSIAGTHELLLKVMIYDDQKIELARSAEIPFSYTSPGP
jgi:hypothetical protein